MNMHTHLYQYIQLSVRNKMHIDLTTHRTHLPTCTDTHVSGRAGSVSVFPYQVLAQDQRRDNKKHTPAFTIDPVRSALWLTKVMEQRFPQAVAIYKHAAETKPESTEEEWNKLS